MVTPSSQMTAASVRKGPQRLRAAFAAVFLVRLVNVDVAWAAPRPHPDLPERFIEEREGVSIEYSPGDEPWVAALLDGAIARNADLQIRVSAPLRSTPSPTGSAADLHAHRDAYLAAIARQIGLDAPTELQARTFDTFLGYYDLLTANAAAMAEATARGARLDKLTFWRRNILVDRLREGEQIPGYGYDPATDSGTYHMNVRQDTRSEQDAAIRAAIDAQCLNHEFSYEHNNGIATISASVRPNRPPELKPVQSGAGDSSPVKLTMPTIVNAERLARGPAATIAELLDEQESLFTKVIAQTVGYRDATVVFIILHETAEVGLIDRRIASADRRWLCDGTANYVAWKVTHDLVDASFARQCYDLDAQLRKYANHQPRIDLAAWPASENQDPALVEIDLDRAHYAFATRAMFLLAERYGPEALPSIWREIGRTPLPEVNSEVFAVAYRTLTQSDLSALIRAAERDPLPSGTDAPGGH